MIIIVLSKMKRKANTSSAVEPELKKLRTYTEGVQYGVIHEYRDVIYDTLMDQILYFNHQFNATSNLPTLKLNFAQISNDFMLKINIDNDLETGKLLQGDSYEINNFRSSIFINWVYQIPSEYFGTTKIKITIRNRNQWLEYFMRVNTNETESRRNARICTEIGQKMLKNLKFCDLVLL